MSRYINEINFPIKLFNRYDLIAFNSFEEAIKFYKKELRITRFDSQKIFSIEDRDNFLEKILDLFPFIFFVELKYIFSFESVSETLDLNPLVKDSEKILDLLFKKINLKKCYKQLYLISNEKGCEVNYPQFVTHLYRYLYKYAFYQIADSLFLDKDKKLSFSDYINDYNLFNRVLEGDSNLLSNHINSEILKQTNQEILRGYIEKIDGMISDHKQVIENTIIELIIISQRPYFSKLLYSIMDINIRFPDCMTPTKKNVLLRPLFHEIVCNFAHSDWFGLDTLDKKLVEKQRNFVRDYKKFL